MTDLFPLSPLISWMLIGLVIITVVLIVLIVAGHESRDTRPTSSKQPPLGHSAGRRREFTSRTLSEAGSLRRVRHLASRTRTAHHHTGQRRR